MSSLARSAFGRSLARGAVLLLLATSWGCSARGTAGPKSPDAAPLAPPAPLEEAELAKVGHRLLLASESSEDLERLVHHQLGRAERLFAAGYDDAAEDAVIGALLLLRPGDSLATAIFGRQVALLEAAHAAAKMGEAGRAEALYEHALTVAAEPNRADIEAHLAAILRWRSATLSASPVLAAGEGARSAASRAVVMPTTETFEAADRTSVAWIEAALDSASLREPEELSRSGREEAIEAYRAVRTAGPGLLAVGIRKGDALSTLAALDQAGLGRALPAALHARVEAAAKRNDPGAWLDLFRYFDGLARDQAAETSLPRYVADGARLWCGVQLYRSSPGTLEHAMPLAAMLVEFQMPEIAARILSENVDAGSSPESVSWSISLLLGAMLDLGRTDQIEAARQSFEEAGPLLALAESSRLESVSPRPVAVYALLSSLETRLGYAERALPLVEKVAAESPSIDGLLRLSTLLVQRGELARAPTVLDRALDLARKSGDMLGEARVEEQIHLLARARGDASRATASLRHALERVLTARAMDLSVVSEVEVERMLARILFRYGDPRAGRRAYERALAASRKNPVEIDRTLTEMAEVALAFDDPVLAARATEQAIELGASDESLVYIAIWQLGVERRRGNRADAIARQGLMRASSEAGWLAAVRAFGLGDIDERALAARARSVPERTEASFYAALLPSGPAADARRGSDKAQESAKAKAMAEVSKSPAVDLLEVAIARELTLPKATYRLPPDLTVP